MSVNNKIGVSIIENGIITSDFSKVLFNEESICIRGGIFSNYRESLPLERISCVLYTSVLPKIRFQLVDGTYTVAMQTTWLSKRKLLAFLMKQGVLCCKKNHPQKNLFRRINTWYQFWYWYPFE